MKIEKLIFLFLTFFINQNIYPQFYQQWVSMYNGPDNRLDESKSIAIDDSGNVFVTGYIEVSAANGGGHDYITLKINSLGTQQWVARYNGPGNKIDKAVSIGIDSLGNSYVTGFSQGMGIGEDFTTIKYSTSGNEEWVRRYTGLVDSADRANSIVVDNSGNSYVTGYSRGYLTGTDIVTIKYNSNGDSLWVKRFNQSGNKYDEGKSVALDKNGNVYVTGLSSGFSNSNDFVTIKYNSFGITEWVRYYGGSNVNDVADGIAVDTSGNVYVTGHSTGNSSEDDYATIKYNSAGVQQWVKRYDGPEHGIDQPKSIALDDSGNVYVTGMSIGVGITYDIATLKYSSSGIERWVKRYAGTEGGYDVAYSIALDRSNNVYVTGKSSNTVYYSDCITIKYDSDGLEKWVERYSRNFTSSTGVAIKIDNTNNVYVTGVTNGNNTGTDFLTIKYTQTITGINANSNNILKGFYLEQNYPNPFNPATKINYELRLLAVEGIKNYEFVKLEIFDVLGKEVSTLVNIRQSPGSYSVEWDAANYPGGIYFYKLTAGNNSEIKKMILLK